MVLSIIIFYICCKRLYLTPESLQRTLAFEEQGFGVYDVAGGESFGGRGVICHVDRSRPLRA